jgi:Flp pilus assembly pilin Flp
MNDLNEIDGEAEAFETVPVRSARRSRGATAVEYALIVALIAGIIIGAVGLLGQRTQGLYQTTENEMVDAGL